MVWAHSVHPVKIPSRSSSVSSSSWALFSSYRPVITHLLPSLTRHVFLSAAWPLDSMFGSAPDDEDDRIRDVLEVRPPAAFTVYYMNDTIARCPMGDKCHLITYTVQVRKSEFPPQAPAAGCFGDVR